MNTKFHLANYFEESPSYFSFLIMQDLTRTKIKKILINHQLNENKQTNQQTNKNREILILLNKK